MQVLFAYKSALDELDPITIGEDDHVWRPGVFDERSGLAKGPFRLMQTGEMNRRDLHSLCSPSIDEIEGVGKLERKIIEAKWWIWPAANLPARLRAAVRSGEPAGRAFVLSRAEILAWVTENPKVAEHKFDKKVLWAPRIECPPDKTRTEV